MAATLKFSKTVKSTVLKSIDTQSKLLELVVLDDAEIEALESGESARGLTLDKIETMSVSELKKALREAEADIDAKDKLISDKNTKLDELDTALRKKRLEKIPPDEEGEALRKEVSMTAFTAEAEIRGNLRAAFRALGEHTEKHGIPHDNFMKGLICQLELAIAQVRGEFHLVGEPDGDPTPAWLRPGAEEAATAVVDEAMAKNGWVRDANGKMIPAELAGKPWTLDETGKVVAAE
jgi:hypothetical protein